MQIFYIHHEFLNQEEGFPRLVLRIRYNLSPMETLPWGWDGKGSLQEGDEMQVQEKYQ